MNQATQTKIQEIVKANYADIAGEFDVTRKKVVWPQLLDLVSDLPAGARVLDVGCGNGRFLEALNGKQIDYLGVDNSSQLIKLAQRNYPDRRFLDGDVLALDQLADSNFDYVFSIAVLHHLPGKKLQREALEQMAQKLAPTGRLVISVWNLWSQPKYRKLILASYFKYLFTSQRLDWGDILFFWKNSRGVKVSERYYHAFSPRQLKKISHEANLKIVQVIKDKFNYYLVLERF
jgi:SAM-dependent methyltransferase